MCVHCCNTTSIRFCVSDLHSGIGNRANLTTRGRAYLHDKWRCTSDRYFNAIAMTQINLQKVSLPPPLFHAQLMFHSNSSWLIDAIFGSYHLVSLFSFFFFQHKYFYFCWRYLLRPCVFITCVYLLPRRSQWSINMNPDHIPTFLLTAILQTMTPFSSIASIIFDGFGGEKKRPNHVPWISPEQIFATAGSAACQPRVVERAPIDGPFVWLPHHFIFRVVFLLFKITAVTVPLDKVVANCLLRLFSTCNRWLFFIWFVFLGSNSQFLIHCFICFGCFLFWSKNGKSTVVSLWFSESMTRS